MKDAFDRRECREGHQTLDNRDVPYVELFRSNVGRERAAALWRENSTADRQFDCIS